MIRLRTTRAVAVLVGLLVAAVAVLGAELASSATRRSAMVDDPCKRRALFPGSGVDATIQRVVLDGLDRAACRLHTSREALVLSLGTRRWNRRTTEAVRAGLLRAVDAAERRGDIPGYLAPLVRRVVERAPIDKLVEGSISLQDLFG
jgi:hypothetical protein